MNIKTAPFTIFLLIVLFVASCTNSESVKEPETFVEKLEQAHHKTAFLSHGLVEFDIQLIFGGKERLNGTLTLSTDSEKGLIREKDGDEIIFIKDQVFYKDRDSINAQSVRFGAYTWPYFFMYPYKLSDPGTVWKDYNHKTLNNTPYLVEQLSFEANVGDSPDDWYITYADSNSHLIHAAAYIVTFGATQDQAEEDPHAIVYENYQKVNGIPVAHHWTFWAWRDGTLTQQLGEATLSNFHFLKAEERSFDVPDSFKEI